MSSDLATLGYRIDSSGLLTADKRLQSMTRSGAVAEGGIGRLGGSFANLKGAIGLAAAAMTAFSAGSFVKDNIFSFDKAMTGLKATTRATSTEMAAFEKQARLLGATSQFSATQAGEAQRFLAMAGFEANEILSATPQILKLASAAEIGLAEAADIASNALGGLQLPVDQLGRVMDVMAEAAASSNTDIGQLAQALKTSAPIATAAGVQIEELAAVIGALSDSGLQAERAGTGLGGIIRQLSNVVPEAEKVWASYGITIEDLSVTNHGLTNVLKTVRDANLNAGDAIKVFGSEAAAAGLIASAFSDHVSDLTIKYQDSSGAATNMAKIMDGSLTAAALGLSSVFSELALMTGDSGLSGAMKSSLVAATGLLHVYTGMLPEFAAANDLTASYVLNLNATSAAIETLAVIYGGVFAISLTKSAVAMSAALIADYNAINASRSAGIARATMAASYAESAVVMSASEVALAKSRASATAFVIAELNAEIALERTRSAAQISQTGRIQSASRIAEIQVARIAITKQLAIEEAKLALAEMASSRAMAVGATATLAVASAQTVATASARVMGAVMAFALGPWGLLITAIGAAAAMFISSKSDADEFTSSISDQTAEVDRLTSSYKGNTAAQLTNTLVKSNETALMLLKERYEIEKKLNAFGAKSTMSSDLRSSLEGELVSIATSLNKVNAASEAAGNSLRDMADNGLNAIEWDSTDSDKAAGSISNVTTKQNEQLQSLRQMQKELGMTSSQLFIFREQQKSLANKDLPGVTTAIENQAAAYLEMKKGVDFGETISALQELSLQQSLTANEYEIHAARMKAADQDLSSTQKTEIENRILAIQKERAAISEATNYSDWLMSVNEAVGQASALEQEILKIQKAMDSKDLNTDVGNKQIENLKKQMEGLKDVAANPFDQMIAGANDAASAMSGMFEAGSKDAQKMGVAMAALNLIAGVGAILNQGAQGDFVSVWGRMAAMAGYVVSLGVSVGGMASGFSDTAASNQEAQGLNVWGEKSESISRAVDLTASATEKIVGINTRMLSALQSMQAGISSAAGMIAGGAGGVSEAVIGDPVNSIIDNLINGPMSTITSFMKKFTGDFLGIGEMVMGWAGSLLSSTIGKWLGGSSKVTDSGIKILGGTISEIISGASVFAYQETQYKKWRFGSKKTQTDLVEMDEASKQVSLIFDSLATSVYEGGVALGMSGTALEDAINNFKIEDIKISLKDLSIEDQQAEIEAVFSKIFDDLAGSVIPFIDKFQQTGEGLGETLSRVATQVAVADEAALRFGITFGDKLADPEAYAQAADNLSMLAGGVDEFAIKIVSFTKFADEATQLLIAENGLTKALAEVGLTLPDSTLGMWELMQSLDGTNEAGQEQIATLLNLQSSASDYYNLLEAQNEQYSSLSSSLRGIIENTYGLSQAASVASLDSALAAARLGDFSAALAGDFSGAMPTSSDFSSLSDFLFEQAVSANKLEELASLSDSQISIDERQLSELEKINQSIRDSFAANGAGNDAVTATQNTDNLEQIKSDINTLTRTMSRMQEQANDALDRIANGVTTVRIEA